MVKGLILLFNLISDNWLRLLAVTFWSTINELFKDLATFSSKTIQQFDGTQLFVRSNNLVKLFVNTTTSIQVSNGVTTTTTTYTPKTDDVNLKKETITFTKPYKNQLVISIPNDIVKREYIWIDFKIINPVRPKDYGLGDDNRQLGVGIESAIFKESM